jgi:cytochrome c oxidase subunit IV
MNIILSPFIFLIPLNLIFLVLTIVKAYYITWDFMHMRDEKGSLRKAVVWTFIFLALYIALIFLLEADYIYEVYKTSLIKWNF